MNTPLPHRANLLWWLLMFGVVGVGLVFLVATGFAGEAARLLTRWRNDYDTRLVLTAALASMACAVPGVFLVLRRQSMMGDALSHTVLPGIVLALLATHSLFRHGWLTPKNYDAVQSSALFAGAMLMGILAALLTEACRKLGEVESSAALGVVFTTLFAAGLLLIRAFADNIHLDPDCVIYGSIETVHVGTTGFPAETQIVAAILLVNLLLVGVAYKELRASAFDPQFSTTIGIPANVMHYALMAVTAATLVAAFRVVGSILVIAMLIAPAATASLLTDRLSWLLLLSLVVAAASAVLGHVLAMVAPAILFRRLSFPGLTDPSVLDASTAGMMAVAAGLLFFSALLFAPRYGLLSRLADRLWLSLRIAGEDVLGVLYRRDEQAVAWASSPGVGAENREPRAGSPCHARRLAVLWLRWQGFVTTDATGLSLTPTGRAAGADLVRTHRLWESYISRHFQLPDDHLHDSAERVEHFVDSATREQLAEELGGLTRDPHGRQIPLGDAVDPGISFNAQPKAPAPPSEKPSPPAGR